MSQPTKSRISRYWKLALFIGLPVLFVAIAIAVVLLMQRDRPNTLAIVPGEETTWYDGPIREDGTVDYIAAFNEIFGSRVVANDNAFAALVAVLPRYEDMQQYRHTQALIGSAVTVPGEARFIFWRDYYREHSAEAELTDEQIDELLGPAYDLANNGPLDPAMVAWADANEPVLAQAMDALARPKYWAPVVDWEDGTGLLFGVPLPYQRAHRELAKVLHLRARLAGERGEWGKAVESIGALKRLAIHQSGEPFLISSLVAINAEVHACLAATAIVSLRSCPSEILAGLAEVWGVEDGRTPVAETINVGERCMGTDGLMQVAAGRETFVGLLGGNTQKSAIDDLYRGSRFEINRALGMTQAYYNELVGIMRLEDYAAFSREIERHESDWQQRFDLAKTSLFYQRNSKRFINSQLPDPQHTQYLTDFYLSVATPALSASRKTEWRIVAKYRCVAAAIACERYRTDRGRMPDDLRQLVPDYLDSVPDDPFDGQPLRYNATDDGFVVYSVGTNLIDDRGIDDHADGDTALVITWTGHGPFAPRD